MSKKYVNTLAYMYMYLSSLIFVHVYSDKNMKCKLSATLVRIKVYTVKLVLRSHLWDKDKMAL
jgi:hypothetical protein